MEKCNFKKYCEIADCMKSSSALQELPKKFSYSVSMGYDDPSRNKVEVVQIEMDKFKSFLTDFR